MYKILRCKESKGVLDMETIESYHDRINECDSMILKDKSKFGFSTFQKVTI
jgi:hypothetical protein